LLVKHYKDDEIKDNEMGEACCMHARHEQCTQYWYGNLKREDNVENLAAEGRININIDLKERGCEGVDWIHLAQARHQWAGYCEHGTGQKARNFFTS
jgi:hypothetical protein